MARRTSVESRGGTGRRTRQTDAITAVATTQSESGRPVPTGTRAIYRGLLMRGLATNEAATLTGYLAGIPIGQAWTLRQVNQLLFLRELDRRGSWAAERNTGMVQPSI